MPKMAWTDRRMRPWLLAGLLGGHAQAAVMGIVGFLVLDRLGLRDAPLAGAGPTGLVLMAGAIATLLAQWGIIPLWHLGPRASCLWGMVLAGLGTALLSVAGDLHDKEQGFIDRDLYIFALDRDGTYICLLYTSPSPRD